MQHACMYADHVSGQMTSQRLSNLDLLPGGACHVPSDESISDKVYYNVHLPKLPKLSCNVSLVCFV